MKVTPVQGQLFVMNVPAEGACVVLEPDPASPLAAEMQKTGLPVATVKADGSFKFSTLNADDGAPPGKYTAKITWPLYSPDPDDPMERIVVSYDRFEGRFNDVNTSTLKIEVQDKPVTISRWDLN